MYYYNKLIKWVKIILIIWNDEGEPRIVESIVGPDHYISNVKTNYHYYLYTLIIFNIICYNNKKLYSCTSYLSVFLNAKLFLNLSSVAFMLMCWIGV